MLNSKHHSYSYIYIYKLRVALLYLTIHSVTASTVGQLDYPISGLRSLLEWSIDDNKQNYEKIKLTNFILRKIVDNRWQ
jgi:hypothetical protein